MEIAVIGGGASGLLAAIAAKDDFTNVTIYEKEARVGKKILATGNGRCNMTNMYASEKDYHSADLKFIKGAINRFWVRETLDFFEELGILWKEEERGKIYPYSDNASAVLDVLRRKVDTSDIKTECAFCVKSIKKSNQKFVIEEKSGEKKYADCVIVAAGGQASPALGSDGSGYKLLKSFGHTVTERYPSLVQIKTETDFVKKLKGIKVKAKVTISGKSEEGELLFTDYGISGSPVFSLSAYMEVGKSVLIDIMPEYSKSDVYNMLCSRCANLYSVPLEDFFVGMLNKRVGQAVLKKAGVMPLSRLSATLTEKEIQSVTDTIKSLTLTIEGAASWNNAQVTKGGVRVNEFNSVTMQSKKIDGLYACGEILDIDGDCGGYNLQWAWSSGYLAGTAAKNSLNRR